MRSVGKYMRDIRKARDMSLEDLEKKTRIKKDFIKALESEEWSKLPDYPVVVGFVKSLAKTLMVDENNMVALLRRDYPPQDLPVNPKPDAFSSFTWSPRLTFISGIVVVVIGVVVYLVIQYLSFTRPPELDLASPTEGQVVTTRELTVSGTTDPEATIRINNQPVIIEEDGSFATTIEVFEGTKEIVVRSVSRSGKETELKREITVELP